jgi:hypothetical protein
MMIWQPPMAVTSCSLNSSDTITLEELRLRIRVIWKEDIMKGHQEKLHAQVMALQLLLQV